MGTIEDERDQLESEEEWLNNWQNLDATPSAFLSQVTSFVIGTVSAANAEAFKEELAKIQDILRKSTRHKQRSILLISFCKTRCKL